MIFTATLAAGLTSVTRTLLPKDVSDLTRAPASVKPVSLASGQSTPTVQAQPVWQLEREGGQPGAATGASELEAERRAAGFRRSHGCGADGGWALVAGLETTAAAHPATVY